MPDNRPIGIFDSGIGGLTIARSVNQLMPDEQILFFGDTAHLPYGDKSTQAIQSYVSGITDFLLHKDCKAILIACNSASAAAYPYLKKKLGKDQTVLNVIDPLVDYVTTPGKYSKIGIIGTKRTIRSRIYPRRIAAANKDIDVSSLATPLLASMIEEGFFNNKISRAVINAYLSNRNLSHIDALVLACTHYPLIKNEIAEYYKEQGESTEIIDSTDVVAQYVRRELKKKGLLAEKRSATPEHHFYVSDFTSSFQKTTQIFFGHTVKLEHIPIWEAPLR